MNSKRTATERFEGLTLVVILLSVGGMAAAASFTHVHDWTMHNAPQGTGDWFGWANAMISDLVPLGVGLEVRRRRRHGLPIGWYPIAIILAAALLSLAGQLAQAKPGPSGWLLSAVPALGFLALTKLVLTRPVPAAPVTTMDSPQETVPDKLAPDAATVVDAYRRATGATIPRDVLAERLGVDTRTAERLLSSIGQQTAVQGSLL